MPRRPSAEEIEAKKRNARAVFGLLKGKVPDSEFNRHEDEIWRDRSLGPPLKRKKRS